MDGTIVTLDSRDTEEMRRIFLSEMNGLLQPAYFLTGSHEMAAECFLEAWETCSNQAPVFGQNPRRTAQTAIVKAAIGKIAAEVRNSVSSADSDISPSAKTRRQGGERFGAQMVRQLLLSLNAFCRAVLVLRLYEGYSMEEAALLLQISRSKVETGWQQALRYLLERLNPAGAAACVQDRKTGLEPEAA